MENINATMLQLCRNIRTARLSTGLSQQEFADKIGEKRSTYAGWEKDLVPSLEKLLKISEATNIPAADFINKRLGESDDKTKVEIHRDPTR